MLKIATAAFTAAAALVAAAPATAAVYTSNIGTVNVPPSFFYANGVNVASGPVQSDYTFTLTSAFTMNGSTFTSAPNNPFTFSSLTLLNSTGGTVATTSTVDQVGTSGGFSIGLAPVTLTSGDYTIRVIGNATGNAAIGSSVSFMAAVPEPATWAMMLVGFGMVGAATRYRRKGTKVAYA